MKKLIYLIVLALILGLVLTGCLLSNVGQVPTSEQSGITYLTKGTEAVPIEFPLYAGQDWLVGEVLVWDDGVNLCVKYRLFPEIFDEGDGWGITETHLAVATSPSGIPQTKKHNPIPGQFLYGIDELEGKDSWEICIPFDQLGVEEPGDLKVVCSDELFIAAHAVVELPEISHTESHSFCIVSDTETEYDNGSGWVPSVLAWVHTAWNPGLDIKLNLDGAEWIWESYEVLHPIAGDIVDFQRAFDIVGTPASGTLYITADNGYEASVNGIGVGSAQVFGDWETSNLTQTFVDRDNWQSVETWDIILKLKTGDNILNVIVANEYMGPLDGTSDGTIHSNPGGLIYKLCVDSEEKVIDRPYQEETAWAANAEIKGEEEGTMQFVDSKSWATYFTYDIEVELPPIISSEDLAGPFTAGELGEFSVTTVNPSCGDTYDLVLFNFTIFDIDLLDIASFDAYWGGGWHDELSTMSQVGDDVTGYFGPQTGFPMSAPYDETTDFEITFGTAGTGIYNVVITLNDLVNVVVLATLTETVEVLVGP